MDLPDLVLSEVFKNLKQVDLIEAPAVCKKWGKCDLEQVFLFKNW